MHIAMMLSDFESGGGQVAGIRLANSLSVHHRVYLVNARPWLRCDFQANDFHENIYLIDLSEVSAAEMAPSLAALFLDEKIDIIHSHVWWADRLAIDVRNYCDIPWVSTLHGCQEFLLSSPNSDPQFWTYLRQFNNYVDGIAYLSPKNLTGLAKSGVRPYVPVRQIYNGLLPKGDTLGLTKERVLDLPEQPHVRRFVLASRAIVEKGWDTAIVAMSIIERSHPGLAHLVLVGDGPFIDACKDLAQKLDVADRVTFCGHSSNPMLIMRECHVGILPSRFVSESLPNCIVEYLASGLAVIASSIGEIENMILAGARPAGLCIEMIDKKPDVNDLVRQMKRYIVDGDLLNCHTLNAKYRYEHLFSMERSIRLYQNLYTDAIMSFTPPKHRNRSVSIPKFSEDVANIQNSAREPDFAELLDITVQSVVSTRLPIPYIYADRGLIEYLPDCKAVSIHAHSLGPVKALLGPYTLKSENDRSINIIVASLSIHARPFEISLRLVGSEAAAFDDDHSSTTCRVSFESVGVDSVMLQTGNLSRIYVLCEVRMLDEGPASYSAAAVLSIALGDNGYSVS